MRQGRLCAYLRSRRKGDWITLLALYAILFQLVIGTVIIYAQPASNYRFSSKNGVFSGGTQAASREDGRSVDTAIALTEARIERNTERLNNLESGIASVQTSIYALEHRLVVLEHVNENMGKLLNLSYGMVISIASALIVSIVNMRLQKGRRNEQVNKEDIRAMLQELHERKS